MANGKSDIKLVDDFDGQVKVEAPDFCVDGGPGRRQGSQTPYRRALVHDADGLTINWDHDYTGGVTINGLKRINAKPPHTMQSPSTVNLTISGSTQIEGFFLKILGDLSVSGQITGDVRFRNDVTLDGRVFFHPQAGERGTAAIHIPGQPVPPPPPPQDLGQVIGNLQRDVAALKQKAGIA